MNLTKEQQKIKEQVLAWEKWKIEKGNYPEYRTQKQMIEDYLNQLESEDLVCWNCECKFRRNRVVEKQCPRCGEES